MKLCNLSTELSTFLGVEQLPRTEVCLPPSFSDFSVCFSRIAFIELCVKRFLLRHFAPLRSCKVYGNTSRSTIFKILQTRE